MQTSKTSRTARTGCMDTSKTTACVRGNVMTGCQTPQFIKAAFKMHKATQLAAHSRALL